MNDAESCSNVTETVLDIDRVLLGLGDTSDCHFIDNKETSTPVVCTNYFETNGPIKTVSKPSSLRNTSVVEGTDKIRCDINLTALPDDVWEVTVIISYIYLMDTLSRC
jgi:hypothetical protein